MLPLNALLYGKQREAEQKWIQSMVTIGTSNILVHTKTQEYLYLKRKSKSLPSIATRHADIELVLRNIFKVT